jgi:DNA polymerase
LKITLDFETASAVDLSQAGAARYWEDPTTEILCLCWSLDNGPINTWLPGDDPLALAQYAADPQVMFEAHNAGFEIAGWRSQMVPLYGFPDIPNERWEDTMAVCAYKAIPLKLEDSLKVLSVPVMKDLAGSRFTQALSRPDRRSGLFDRSAASIARVVEYCRQDVLVEQKLSQAIGKLSPEERKVWLLDLKINQRGVALDLPYIRAAIAIVNESTARLTAEFTKLTGGLNPTQRDKVLDWVKGEGVQLPNLQKETLKAVLGKAPLLEDEDEEEDDPDPGDSAFLADVGRTMPDHVRRALEIRGIVGSASIKKLPRMLQCVMSDGRVRGVLQYHGAGTGRWAGRLLQPQNFPRGTIKIGDKAPPVDLLVNAILTADADYVEATLGNPIEVVLSGLRHALICAPGHALVVGDFAGVEARIVLALAGQHDKADLMASGADVYCDMASMIYGRKITKADAEERHTGKGGVLGCGFGLGWANYIVKFAPQMSEQMARKVVSTYREDWAPCVPLLWKGLENAATETVWTGKPHEAYGVTYALRDGWLTATLPSGQVLWYRDPRKALNPMPWDDKDIRKGWAYHAKKNGRWVMVRAYGGLLTENVVQALARGLMIHSMFLCEQEGLPVVLTVHDEIVCEPVTSLAKPELLSQIMCSRPRWAEDIRAPIAAECWSGSRYRKG